MHILGLVDAEGLDPDSEQSLLHPSEIEPGETTRGVMDRVEALAPRRVVFDSLSEMRLLAQNPLRYRRRVLGLKHFFVRRGCAVLLSTGSGELDLVLGGDLSPGTNTLLSGSSGVGKATTAIRCMLAALERGDRGGEAG